MSVGIAACFAGAKDETDGEIDNCHSLLTLLHALQVGYPCLSLHGAKDQSDRESTINDFKTGVSNVLVATSIAARGLDVKDLVLVVNYEVPNHHEDYVHRVGRTGKQHNNLLLCACEDIGADCR